MGDAMNSYGVGGARNCDEQEETSTLRPGATETNPTEWTDEKHSMYLKSMEATFIDQLNKSLNLLGGRALKNCQSGSKLSKHKHNNFCAPSQFKVLRDGCWSKTDFREGEAETSREECRGISANPWIQHYRFSERQENRRVLTSRAKDPSATNVNQSSTCNFRLWCQDSADGSAEVTDQNFKEDDVEEEKCGWTHGMKRTRTSVGRVPCNDQVVPFENIVGVNDVAEDHARSED